jgi:hypothetical protein
VKRILMLLISILLIAAISNGFTACGPSEKAQQEHQQELEEYEQRLEEVAQQEERQAVLYWAEYAASIIENDEQLRNWWEDYKSYEDEELTSEAEETMKAQVSTHQERYEELLTIASDLDTPDTCSEAQQLLVSYLDTIRRAASSRLNYYETSDSKYQDEASELEAEGSAMREQFIQEYTDIVQEWDLTDQKSS